MNEKIRPLIIIGGGASGMMAAICAARRGVAVTLLEQNQKVGRKLYITGKGRCNLTNHCSYQEVLAATPRNSRFLHSAMSQMPPEKVERFFKDLGVPLKVERGNRVFPVSDQAADIIDALFFELRRCNVTLLHTKAIEVLTHHDRIVGVRTERGDLPCKAVILATGGLSYPGTGSTGDGHRMALELGHTVIPSKPSLIPLNSADPFCARMQGLALKNVVLSVKNNKKKLIFQEQGELLFTHFGMSGPLVLSASAHMRDFESEQYICSIDLKPALDETTLDARLVRELTENTNKDMANIMGSLLPRLMIPVVLDRTEIHPATKAHDLTRAQRRRLLEMLKGFTIAISGPRPVHEAIVTSGGVKVNEVDPKTMASKVVEGLYFSGELLDVDAYTGGFNLQIAWATGHTAGERVSDFLLEVPQSE